MRELFLVSEEDQGKRVDLFVSEKLGITRVKAQQLIEENAITINNTLKPKSYKLKLNDKVEITTPILSSDNVSDQLVPQNLPLDIIYKDEYIVVMSKPAGMVVYPCAGHTDGTVMNALAYHVKKLATVGGPLRPGVVHRLDKETSGIMVIAIDDKAYYKIIEQFKKREVKKEYLTILYGIIQGKGKISLAIGRDEHDRKKMSVKSKRAKEAITEWEAVKNFKNYTLVKAKILTGRTHQIRVHFSSIGHPVLGDKTYGRKTYIEIGRKKIPVPRQMLHAHILEFTHPITGELLRFEASIPEDMKNILKILTEENSR
ncbi:RluA family pseudouridine synthase [Thermodesulfovibrio hydrogeniphilus]